jgi:SAM-dependent methyltransferase
MATGDDELIEEQRRYYDERAPIYDDLYFRRGVYAFDDEATAAVWQRETDTLERFVQDLQIDRSAVLELACGTGLWTRFLVQRARRVVAVDSSPRMLEENRRRVADDRVRYERVDLFAWEHGERFDLVFAGFFLSHVPPDRWVPFWSKVAGWVAPGGAIAFVDDAWGRDRPRSGDRDPDGPEHAHRRQLGEDRFTIVKRFFRPDELELAFATAGIAANVATTGEHFLFGAGTPRPA